MKSVSLTNCKKAFIGDLLTSNVLLKNEGGLLLLQRDRLQSIAVIGLNAASAHLAGYSDGPGRGISVLVGTL